MKEHLARLNNRLNSILEFGGWPKGWKRPVVIRTTGRAEHENALTEIAGVSKETIMPVAYYASPSNISKKKFRNISSPYIKRSLLGDLRKKGVIIAPTARSPITRWAKNSATPTPELTARTSFRHELVHALREPRSKSRQERRAPYQEEGFLKRLKEEWAANNSTLLGRRGKQLGTPLISRLDTAIRKSILSARS